MRPILLPMLSPASIAALSSGVGVSRGVSPGATVRPTLPLHPVRAPAPAPDRPLGATQPAPTAVPTQPVTPSRTLPRGSLLDVSV